MKRFQLAVLFTATLAAQTDPGPRPRPQNGPPAAGQPIRGLNGAELQAFQRGRDAFAEIDNVSDGLGPRFNLDSCAGCHAHPSTGGTSPGLNPQFAVAAKLGAINTVPNFLQQDGPVRVVRFRRAPDGAPDGGVHDLFVITGRSDAPSGCRIQQPDFSNLNNLAFRIPTPTFGLGLIESITDSALRANLAATADRRRQFGIQGRFNTNGNDGTITRFGWKAQNKSLSIFSGEAYNVEMGVTNEIFPQERDDDPACISTSSPESHAGLGRNRPGSDVVGFSDFMRFLAPPQPAPATESIDRGRALFEQTGCALCHTAQLQTGASSYAALSQQDVNLYSDLALHRMGQALNDGVPQGAAQGDDWRTAPLWGLGDRIFFLHDGRTKDLLEAIRIHDSQGSEARQVIQTFQGLSAEQKQDILNFLRSL
jgi:CxxC motif-containing protein (DUF1111 family)